MIVADLFTNNNTYYKHHHYRAKMPKKEDDNSDWSDEDGIPAVEILNYDLINIGLKAFSSNEEPNKVSSANTNGESSESTSTSSDESTSSEEEVIKSPETRSDPPNMNDKKTSNSATKVKYKIAHLPPPETDGSDKIIVYEDHNHFLKHAAAKAKAVRKNSVKNMFISPEDIESDRRPSVAQNSGSEKRFDSDEIGQVLKGKSSLMDEVSDSSDDEIQAVEILNYDLNNIGLQKLHKHDTTVATESAESSVIPPTPEPMSKTSSLDDSSDFSNGEIPAIEILNYDLNNVGLKALHSSESAKSDADANRNERKIIKHSSDPPPSNQKTLDTAALSEEEEDCLDTSTEQTSSERIETATSRQAANQDDSSDDCEDEIPAIEILNYDLNNVGLKAFDVSKSDLFSTPSRNTIDEKKSEHPKLLASNDDSDSCEDEIPAVEILNYDLNNYGLKALDDRNLAVKTEAATVLASNQRTEVCLETVEGDNGKAVVTESKVVKPSFPSDDDLSDQSEDEIPAVEILNYDLINIGLKKLSGDDEVPQTPVKSKSPTKLMEDEQYVEDDRNSAIGNFGLHSDDDDYAAVDTPSNNLAKIATEMQSSESSLMKTETKVAPFIPSKPTSESLDDVSSQQTKVSSIPGKDDFYDHGHFLTIAAEKVASKQKNEGTKQESNRNHTTMTVSNPEVESSGYSPNAKYCAADGGKVVAENMAIQQPAYLDGSGVQTVVTTKTVVEPDGTVVTTTTVVTKTMRNVNNSNVDSSHPFPIIEAAKGMYQDSAGQADVGRGIQELGIASNTGVISTTESGKESMAFETLKDANADNYPCASSNLNNIPNKRGVTVKEPMDQSVAMSNVALVGNTDTNVDHVMGIDRTAQGVTTVIESDVNENLVQSANSIIRNSFNDVAWIGDLDDENSSCGSNQAFDSKDDIANSSGKGNDGTKIFSVSKRDKYEDHVDFLSEAASYQSDVDLQSIAEEEKRNDAVAMRKILSFGSNAELSPLDSPSITRAGDVKPFSDKQYMSSSFTGSSSKNSLDIVQKNDSEGSESDWIEAKEILNYDLINVGLKELHS